MQRKGVVGGNMQHLVFRPTMNQSAVRIEELVSRCCHRVLAIPPDCL